MKRMENKTKTPRPVPVISDELTFSRKKKGRLDKNYIPPRSPMKSAPPISRIFRQRHNSTPGAQSISFKRPSLKEDEPLQSPLYTNVNKPFFEQCFTRLSRLGYGSFGEVVKVQSKEDGKLYAVKKARQPFRGDYDRKQRLEEVRKNEILQGHPNCVYFYKAWEELGFLYIQTELCEMSLNDYSENVQVIDEAEIWNIVVDLTHGLKHIHNAQFAHMDIKPANLFLGRDGLYKIGDFGLVVEVSNVNDALEGDPKYIAPELLDGKFSKAADIYSLGISILELACTLDLPKGGPLWQQLRNGKLPMEFTQGLSDDLILLIQSMMDPNPDTRPTVDNILNYQSVLRAQWQRQKFGLVSKVKIKCHQLWLAFLFFLNIVYQFLILPKHLLTRGNRELSQPTTPPLLSPTDKVNKRPGEEPSFVGHETIHGGSHLGTPPVSQLYRNEQFKDSPDRSFHLSPPIKGISFSAGRMRCKSKSPLFGVPRSGGIRKWMEHSPTSSGLTPFGAPPVTSSPFCFDSSPNVVSSSPHVIPGISPRIPATSERLFRSKLFVDSEEEEEEDLKFENTAKNLMLSFNEVACDEE